eukprot:744449-Alexandrium_andersonii.AAC.1
MVEEARGGWGMICRGKSIFGPDPDEKAMGGAALWIAEQADELGVRPPNAGECARAWGVWQCCEDLGLDERALASALGNSFDKDLVGLRLEAGLVALLNKPKEAAAAQDRTSASPAEAAARWYQLLADLQRNNMETDVYHPYPAGLRDEAAWGELARLSLIHI